MKPKSGKLNADGKVLVARVLVGRMVGDADLLSNTRHRTVESLARSIPYMVQAQAYGDGYDLTHDLQVAMGALNTLQDKADASGKGMPGSSIKPEEFNSLLQTFKNLPGMETTSHEILVNERARALLEVLIRRPGTNQMASVFREYAKNAKRYPEGQKQLMAGDNKTPSEVFRHTIQAVIDKEAREEARAAEEKARKEAKQAQGQTGGLALSMQASSGRTFSDLIKGRRS